MKKSIIFSLFFFLLLAILVSESVYVFQYNEYAVVREFGRVVRVHENGGLRFKIPFIHNVQILPKKTLFYDASAAEVTTMDKKRILVDYYIMWRIENPTLMLENLRTLEASQDRLSDILYSAVRNELGKLEYSSIINPEDNNRGNIDQLIYNDINQNLAHNKTGIILKDVQMKRIDLPPSNEESVYKRMISERESKAQEYLSQGEAEKTRIIAETDREVEQRIAIVNAEAQKIIAEGQGQAQNLRNFHFGRDVEFFNLYRTLESYKQSIQSDTVILLPINSPYLRYITGE